MRHQIPLRPLTKQNPPINRGSFITDNNLSRNVVFPNPQRSGVSSSGVPWNSENGNGDGFKPSVQLPYKFVANNHPKPTVAPLPSWFQPTNQYSFGTTRQPNLSPINGRPFQKTLLPVNSDFVVGGRFSNNTPPRSYTSATVTGRPSEANYNLLVYPKQESQKNLIIPIGAALTFNQNANDGFTDNVITDDKTEIISLKNLESRFKRFKAVDFFDESHPNSDIIVGIPGPTLSSPNPLTKVSKNTEVEKKQAISFVDELDASPSSPSLIAESSSQMSTPRMFTEFIDMISGSTSRPPAFDGQKFVKEIGRYPDVFSSSSPSPAPALFPTQNNNQQLIISNQPVKPNFQNANTPSPKPVFQNSNSIQNTLDSSSASGPNPSSFNNNINNVPNIRFPVEAFRGATTSNNRPHSQKEPLSDDLLNLVNSLRGRLQPNNGRKQQPRQPKNNQVQGVGGRRKNNRKKKNRTQKAKKTRLGKQQRNINNAIQVINKSSSLDGRLGRQATGGQKFGPNSAGPVVEGFPAGLPAATPEGVKIALSSPLGKYF